MSDFDKEAEREKLRERFAEEDEKRETTEQMSELLLQGATMTDTHCDNCGNPLFRYDGQTFCPNCQQTAGGGGAGGQTAAENETPTGDEPAPADDQQTAPEQQHAQPSRNANQTPPRGERPAAGQLQNRHAPTSQTDDTAERGERQPETTTRPSGTDDLGAAEASLSRTLAELTATAEQTADLGRTREHLAAAREAAEALNAVRTARK